MIAIESKNRMFSIASVSQAPGGPHHGQAWVAGSAAIRYFEERGFYCFVPAANSELPQTPLEMMRRCLVGSRPPPTPLFAGKRGFKPTKRSLLALAAPAQHKIGRASRR